MRPRLLRGRRGLRREAARSGTAHAPSDLYDVVNLYRRADLHDERDLVMTVLERQCAHKDVAVPTLAAVTWDEKAADLRADWHAMLAHQLPELPPVEDFHRRAG